MRFFHTIGLHLFALVAGNLVKGEDTFKTMSKTQVTLRSFVQERNADEVAVRCGLSSKP